MDTKTEIIINLHTLLRQLHQAADKIEFCESIVHPEVKKIFINDLERRYNRQTSLASNLDYREDMFQKRRASILSSNKPAPEDIQISGSIIVKDEEEAIERAIVSCYHLCDEFCVLDTGSSDGTIETVKKYPKVKLFQTIINPWDFSEARNYCFDFCSGRIIFVIDADEELKSNDIQIRESVLLAENEILSVSRVEISEIIFPMTRLKEPRFFPKGSIRWENKLHNVPVILSEKTAVVGDTGIEMYHFPEGYKKKTSNRQERNSAFVEEIKNEEDSFWKWDMILKTASQNMMIEEANDAVAKGLGEFKALPPDVQQFNAHFLLCGTRARLAARNLDIGELLGRYTGLVGADVDSAFYNHLFFEHNSNFYDAANWLDKHFEFAEDFGELRMGMYETLRFYDDALLKLDLYDLWRGITDPNVFQKGEEECRPKKKEKKTGKKN